MAQQQFGPMGGAAFPGGDMQQQQQMWAQQQQHGRMPYGPGAGMMGPMNGQMNPRMQQQAMGHQQQMQQQAGGNDRVPPIMAPGGNRWERLCHSFTVGAYNFSYY